MDQLSATPRQRRVGLVCPITLDVHRDSVLTIDRHVCEGNTINQWIEKQGTSQSLSFDDLEPVEYTKQEYQLMEGNPVTYCIESNATPLSPPSIFDSDDHCERKAVFKQNCNSKRMILIVLIVGLVLVSLVVIIAVSLSRYEFGATSTRAPLYSRNPRNVTYPPTRYLLPNNCTLSRIVSLFSWDNVRSFNFTYYSIIYQAVSNKTILTFAFRHSPSYWCLDNVSMIDTSSNAELMINGHFDNQPSDGFIRCNAFASTSTSSFMPPPYSFTVQRSFCDGSVGLPDYLSQTLNTKIGQMYQISFWLQNGGNAPNGARVVMSY